MLIEAKGATPRPVQLDIEEDAIFLDQPGRTLEELALRYLVRRGEDRGIVRLGRAGRPGWELRISGGAAREVLAVMPGTGARLSKLAGYGWYLWPVWAAMIALLVAQIPADWAASLTPAALEHRALPAGIYDDEDRCTSPMGDGVIRRFISRFDPSLGKDIRIDVVRSSSFVLTSLPDRRLLISDTALRDTDPDALAALIAHEIAHLKNDDALEALFRARGPVETYSRIIFGSDEEPNGSLLRFSRAQELDADRAALAMLVAADISLEGGANFYVERGSADALTKAFGSELGSLHAGDLSRSVWLRAVIDNPGNRPAFTQQEVTALTNFCPPEPRS